MNKKSLEIACYVAGAGAFGVFFRWLQVQLAFDDAGLNKKSALNLFVPALIIAAALLFAYFLDVWKARHVAPPEDFCRALYNPGRLFPILRWLAALIMIAGSVLLLMTTEADPNADLIRVMCLLAFLSGLGFPFALAQANYDRFGHKAAVRLAMLMPVLLYALWLVLSYIQNSLNSVPRSYAMEMFALICAMMGFFRVSSFAFGVSCGYRALFAAMMGASMCIMALADERNMGMQLLLLSSAGMLLLYVWIMVRNLDKKIKKVDAPEEDDGGFETLN